MTFVDFVKEKCTLEQRIWVYGLGTSGRLFTDLCLQNGIKVTGIIVGDGYKEAEFYKEVPVYEVKDDFLHAGQLFYTVKSKIENTVSDAVISMFSVIDLSSRQDYDIMLEIYYEQYWKTKNVRMVMEDKANWKFGGVELCSTKPMGTEGYRNFLSEAGDLLLPPIWGDYERIDEGTYEYGSVQLKDGDVVFDCGANIGIFSAVAAWKGANVYAFEPLQECFTQLQKQSVICSDGRIFPVNFALSDHCGRETIFFSENGMTEASLFGTGEKQSVEVITIDEYVRKNNIKHVDFIKADIEGAERDMLSGAKETLRKFAPKLAICTYHRPDDKEVLSNIIMEANPDYHIEYKWKKLYACL